MRLSLIGFIKTLAKDTLRDVFIILRRQTFKDQNDYLLVKRLNEVLTLD